MTKTIDPLGNASETGYDALGRVDVTVDAGANAAYFNYNARDQLTEQIDPLGGERTNLYTWADKPEIVYDENRNCTYYSLDAASRVTSWRNHLADETEYLYDSVGRRHAVIDPEDNVTYTHYDAQGRQSKTIDALGGEMDMLYDDLGRVVGVIDPLDRVAYMNYDILGRVVSAISPLGNVTYSNYDALGRVTETIDPLGKTVDYQYDEGGNVIATVDPEGNATYYEHDALNRRTEEKDAAGQATLVGYDAASRATHARTAGGLYTYFQYDARGLRSETHALVGSGVGDNWYYFQYDGVGRTISSCQTAASDVRYWNYDAGGRMTGEHQPSGWVDSGYDKADRRTYMLDTSDSVTYHNYDRRGLVTSVIDPSAQVITTTRDARGAEIKRELPNGTVSYMNYDLAGQSTSVLHRKSGGDVPIAMYYTYDDDGKPTQRVGVHGALDWTTYYAYDGAGRLTREHWVDDGDATMHAFTWQYDDAGNRIAMTTADATTYYDFNTLNQLTRLDEDGTDTYFEYTTDGQLEVQNSVAQETYFEWYFDGALRKVVDQTAGVDHLHEYDDSAKRWRDGTVGESTRTDFIYDGEKVLETHDYSDNVMASYVHAGPGIMQPLLAQTKSEATEWVLSDSMGSTLGLIDSDEALTLSLLYDAWGNELLDSGAGSTPYRYIGAHGYHLDDHSGLSYLWNRYYDRGVGRFASRDPLEDLVNKYWYVSARPTWSVDPRGEAEPTWPDPNSPPTGNKHKEPYIPVEPPAIPLPLGMEETGPWDWMPGLGSDSVVAPIAVGAGAVVVGGHYVHWRATGFSKCWWDCTNSVWNVWSVTTNSFVNSLIRAGLILGIGKLIGVRLSAIVFAATSRACTVYCDIKWVLDDIKGPIP